MREPKAPTLDELLKEMESISPIDTDGKTITEWAQFWEIGVTRAKAIIYHAVKTGRMKSTPVHRPDVVRPGRRVQVWLLSFVHKKRGGK